MTSPEEAEENRSSASGSTENAFPPSLTFSASLAARWLLCSTRGCSVVGLSVRLWVLRTQPMAQPGRWELCGKERRLSAHCPASAAPGEGCCAGAMQEGQLCCSSASLSVLLK